MDFFVRSALGCLLASALGAWLCRKNERCAAVTGAAGAVLAALIIFAGSTWAFWHHAFNFYASFFQLVVALVGAAAAMHAIGYLAGEGGKKFCAFWSFYHLTFGAMLAVTALRSFIPFLIAWEVMGLASFFLVMLEYENSENQRAAWIYLLGCEAGGLLLMLAFALSGGGSAAYFYLLLAGFGLKIGFPLLHVWLPEAHPAAPAPVSALMSGAMIPLGFCGLFRFMPHTSACFGHAGWALLILGLIGAFFGILFAAGQSNLKRLLAYSSIENMGIISLGFGLGFLGKAYAHPTMALLGLGGGVLHVFNHAVLKGMLFLGAGSVLRATGTLQLDEMGGLMKKMPVTGRCFLCGAIAICGLPPFCGFTGELLIYIGAFSGIAHCHGALFAGALMTAIVLALTGGVACAALAKAAGGAFLGEPRTEASRNAAKEKLSMVIPQLGLLFLALALPLFAGTLPDVLHLTGKAHHLLSVVLAKNALFCCVFYTLIVLVLAWRRRAGRDARAVGTWDCGYARPTGRMEYTASALTQPIADQFDTVLGTKREVKEVSGLFPATAKILISCRDAARNFFWDVIFHGFARFAEKCHALQSGYLHFYIFMMVLALAAMLAWGFWA